MPMDFPTDFVKSGSPTAKEELKYLLGLVISQR